MRQIVEGLKPIHCPAHRHRYFLRGQGPPPDPALLWASTGRPGAGRHPLSLGRRHSLLMPPPTHAGSQNRTALYNTNQVMPQPCLSAAPTPHTHCPALTPGPPFPFQGSAPTPTSTPAHYAPPHHSSHTSPQLADPGSIQTPTSLSAHACAASSHGNCLSSLASSSWTSPALDLELSSKATASRKPARRPQGSVGHRLPRAVGSQAAV